MSISPLFAFLEGPELIIILAILLILFGGAKLPQLARSVGSAQREFKKGVSGDNSDVPESPSSKADVPAQTSGNSAPSDSDKS
ncbi:MAG TPA: twin-arginine translocase TatA/TatE family subunit [Acidimicrobiales bacterium]|nr:twin-arginine translocase TatA/TatE family subunit [Acidimicrobiales bacterium]